MNKRKSGVIETLIDLVTEILMKWNPIQIPKCELLKDEYSSYAPQITQMLFKGKNEDTLFRHLKCIRLDSMKLASDDKKDRETAKELVALNIESKFRKENL